MASLRKKIVVVGDGNCGKTCMLMVYKDDPFLEKYVPTVFESYVFPVTVAGKKLDLTLVDTAGQEDYDRLRPLTYPGTDVVIAVFSIADPDSLDNIMHRWVPEIRHYSPTSPIVLVGNKKDLREDVKTISELRKRRTEPVSYAEGVQMSHNIKAFEFLECSAKLNQGVKQVIEAATKAAMTPRTVKKKKCVLL